MLGSYEQSVHNSQFEINYKDFIESVGLQKFFFDSI